MTKVEITVKMQGHNRQAGRWEKQAKREGKDSQAYKNYIHHTTEWVRLHKLLNGE